jgi:hypothetical protein
MEELHESAFSSTHNQAFKVFTENKKPQEILRLRDIDVASAISK